MVWVCRDGACTVSTCFEAGALHDCRDVILWRLYVFCTNTNMIGKCNNRLATFKKTLPLRPLWKDLS